ncbi:regulator of microtubule dynamics protein 2-like isoform X3 [Branchiostoma floridae]|uniref:Regulator of microtubule dynamics protein 2-like isoform X3 n=1 Tax=Branchiostoma floridae TaxID=7739 RepID=A0A9J7HWS7_BRAFL|nr:regulator of microtubule dynamics protein 2-like isoform X3 [Branchiostoma floridae]
MPFGVEVDKKTLAAVGVGVLVGAGSAMVFSYLARMRTNPPHALHERPATVRDLAMLQDTVEKLKEEVVGLREKLATSSGGRRRRARENSGYASVTSASEYMSVTSGDDDEDEGGYMTPPDTDTDVAAVTFDEGALQLTALEASLVRVDTLHNGSLQNKEEAYNMLVQLKEKHGGSAEVLWRLSRSMMAKFDGEADPQKRQDLCFQAKGLAEVALAIDANSADAHKWFAIALGSCSEFLSVQDKIKDGYKFKEHIERALELRPNDATVHHLLGRWCYEVTMLSWVERKVASALFAAPPNSSVDEALEHFLEAEDIEPGFYKANSLYIAKCYIQNSDYCNATLWLEKALQQPINDEEDRTTQTEVTQLLQKYKPW